MKRRRWGARDRRLRRGSTRLGLKPRERLSSPPNGHAAPPNGAITPATRAIHDLNNLMTAIGGHVYLALSELDADHPAREFVTAIQEALEAVPALLRAFPRTPAEAPEPRREAKYTPAALAQPKLGQGLRILYVDDEEALVALAKRFLGRLGHQVSGFCDAPLALETFRSHPQDFDAVVSDISMPALSGVDLVRKILEIRRDVLVVMSSGHVGPEELALARSAGACELIAKPQSMAELGTILHRILTDRQAQAPAEPAWTSPRSSG